MKTRPDPGLCREQEIPARNAAAGIGFCAANLFGGTNLFKVALVQ
jgi:hypothetical protein